MTDTSFLPKVRKLTRKGGRNVSFVPRTEMASGLYVKRIVYLLSLLWGLFFIPQPGTSTPSLNVTSEPTLSALKIFLLHDDNGYQSPDQAFGNSNWKPLTNTLHTGYSSEPIWLRLEVVPNRASQDWVLSFSNALLDEVILFQGEIGNWSEQYSGENMGRERWALDARSIAFPLKLEMGKSETLLVRLQSKNSLYSSITLVPRDSYDNASRREATYYGIYFGLYIVLIIFHGFFWGLTSEAQSGGYLAYLSSSAAVDALTVGLPQYLLYLSPTLSDPALGLLMSVALISAVRLSMLQLQIDLLCPRLSRNLVRGTISLSLFSAACVLIGHFSTGIISIQIASLLLIIFFSGSAIFFLAKGHKPARFFLVVFGIYYAGISICYLRNLSLLPSNQFTENASSIGTLLHMLLMSLRLIGRHNKLRMEKEVAQQAIISATREMNEVLEQKVTQRTITLYEEIERRKALEGELRSTLDRERQLAEMKHEFVAMVSHEFNTPLAIINTSAQQIMRNVDGARAKLVERCNNIRSQVQRMGILVDRYLADEKLRDESNFNPTTCETKELLDRSVIAWSERISVTYRNLPKFLHCDSELLLVALRNLLANADRHSPPDQAIKFVAEGSSCGLRIDVINRGEPIPPDEIPLLFQKFFRGRQAQSKHGRGLGLYIVRHIARIHGGDVVLQNLNHGDEICFSLTLPCNDNRHCDEQLQPVTSQSGGRAI